MGGGIAGTTAAGTIRRLDPEGHITLLTDEDRPLYARIRLPELLSGTVGPDQLILRRPEWYGRNRIDLRPSTFVANIDAEGHTLETSEGERIPYDRLLLATGSRANVPPIEGADIQGVYTLRTMEDALAIKARVGGGGRKVAVIGGGVLGLEVAYHLLKAGNRVEVIEFFPRLLPKQTDPESSTIFQTRLESMGLSFQINGRSKRIAGGAEGPEAVLLEDGRRVDCDTVVISAGVRPTVKLATKLGLRIERGIVVDDHLHTGVPDVWAAGDLIQHRGVTYGIWPPAERQGEVAAANMTGGDMVYEGSTISNTLKVVGVDLFAAGDIDPAGVKETIIVRNPTKGVYRKLVLEGRRIVGSILLGDSSDQKRVLRAITDGLEVGDAVEGLRCWDLRALD